MPVPSLLELAQKKAMRNIRAIQDVGLVPYRLLKPILAKVDRAEHLRTLELNSPHIEEDNAELWINFIKRDIPGWEQIELPAKPECWYDVYRELMEKAQEQLDRDAQKMKSALEELNSDRAKNTARVVDAKTLRTLPKERPTQKQRYAAHDRRMGGLRPVFAESGGYKPGGGGFGNLDGPVHSFETPRLPRAGSGNSSSSSSKLFAPVKRQKALNVPTHKLMTRATPVQQAPRAFVDDHKIAKSTRPPTKAPSGAGRGRMIAPGRQKVSTGSTDPASNPSLQDREARLRNLMSSKPKPAPAVPDTSQKRKTSSATTPAMSPPSAPPSTSSPKPKPAATTATSPPTSPSNTITLLGCAPSNAPRRIKRVQASPTKSTSPVPKSSTTKPAPADTNPSASKPPTTTQSPNNSGSNNKPSSTGPPMIRKRPPPPVFIQPKKRKII